MSANNYWLIHKVGPRYYGWDLMAELWGSGTPEISIAEARTGGTSAESVAEKLKDSSFLGYAEYGVVINDLHLPKDGELIKIKELSKRRRIDGIYN